MINDIPIISAQTWGLSNLSILFFELIILSTDKAVFMNNMSLHFNDYEEKSEKNVFFLVSNINIVRQNYSNLRFEQSEHLIF